MATIELFDQAHFSDARVTNDGYLVADVRVARTGIQEYQRRELGLVGDGVVRVYRPEDEVFDQSALSTYAHRPMTLGHPSEMVNAENWKELAVGQTGGEVVRDGDYVRVPMVVMDSAAIQAVQAGKRQLSMGYTSVIDIVDGVTPLGEPYDAVQRGLRMNHLAIVAKARGGSKLKVGDEKPPMKGNAMSDGTKLRTVIVDGLSVETTDAGAQAIEKLQKELSDAAALQKSTSVDHDAEIATKDAEIEGLKGKIIEAKDLDAMVAERAKLVTDAATVAGKDVDIKGKTKPEIMRMAVVARLGDAKVEGKSEAYVEAMFDALLDTTDAPKRDSFADGVQSGVKTNDSRDNWDGVFKSSGVPMKKEG